MNTDETNTYGMTHEDFEDAVDSIIMSVAGVGIFDLADYDTWSAWANDLPPSEVAREMLEKEGFPVEAFDYD